MGTQPKVIFTIYHPNSKPLKREVVLVSSSQVGYSGIEVTEYAKVDVQLVYPSDNNAILKIETCESNDELNLKPLDVATTIMSGANTEYMLVPGHYRFEVITSKSHFVSYYTVRSKDFSDESLLNLRLYLESLLQGLSYDIIRQKLGMATPIVDFNPTLLQLFQFINKYKGPIQRNLDMILQDPITDLIGEYTASPAPRKLDSKSFRWQAQKGEQKKSLSSYPSLYYTKHATLTFNNIENQWIKFIIYFFLQRFRKLEMSFQKEILQVSQKIKHQNIILQQNRKQIEIGNNAFGYKKSLEGLNRNKKRIINRIEELEKEKGSYIEYRKFLRQLNNFFTEYEENNWIKQIPIFKPRKITQRLLKDYRYRKIYLLYKELVKIESKKIESNLPGLQFRRTWQLFEYYNVGLVINILRENNYKWVDGWLASKDSPHHHIGTLPPDTILRFEKEDSDHYIEVAYDTEIESTIIDQSYSRYFNNVGRRPDIRITIYHQDGSLYSDKAGLIVESKCRRHKYLINQNIDPDVKLQLRDFKNLEYFDSLAFHRGNDPVKTPINKVIVLYPKQSGVDPVKADHVYGESMLYIQVEPSDPNSDIKSFGYDILKEKIDDFLSQIQVEEGAYVK
ncbi:DUF2357 domain-containing protein [Sporosarcina sp. Sa2YVA2]|uniref:DUF2357 domain-containing protein n=1 Tax=Sporosarcina quadrami TaxID=2762234 RepID=A0ABR8UD40_9BACL|nr:DUF2357 domain-containing protein [Sporosarcina quadrami]MBD7985952.1 DUF2357 domain-containing protein [Sporosarcina quadrami]